MAWIHRELITSLDITGIPVFQKQKEVVGKQQKQMYWADVEG